ncbi:MAG: ABC transporter family substrate-binding protein [Solirubrobacteraceae bacterium]
MYKLNRIGALAALASAALAVGACGGSDNSSGGGGSSDTGSSGESKASTALDINAQPRDNVKEGGVMRWAVDQFSTQWNYNQVNGPEATTLDVIDAVIPQPFIADEKANVTPDPDFITKAEVTSDKPETIELTLNEKAKWSDGTPITANDYITQWKALNGSNPKFQIASSTGYDQIKSVTANGGDYGVKIVFAKPFAEWNALFTPLYPAKYQDTPEHFNKGYFKQIPVTAGPFKLDKIDKTAKTITVVKNPDWWGDPAKLDKIVYRALEISAGTNAFVNGEVDVVDVGPDPSAYKRTSGAQGATVHEAGGPDFRHFTINGSKPPLSDLKVRQAIAKGINRAAIAKSDLTGLGDWKAETMDNHFFVNTQVGYQDNTGDLGQYDPEGAKKLLEEDGWKMDGQFYAKDGKQLKLRFVIPSGVPTSKQEGELTQAMLKDIGVNLDIVTVPSDDFFDKYVIPANYEITPFSWLGTPYPISSSTSIYQQPTGENFRQNFARVGSPEIDDLMKQANATFDTDKSRELLNQADAKVWEEVHSLIMYQRPQITATKSNLANFGSFGFMTRRLKNTGFVK